MKGTVFAKSAVPLNQLYRESLNHQSRSNGNDSIKFNKLFKNNRVSKHASYLTNAVHEIITASKTNNTNLLNSANDSLTWHRNELLKLGVDDAEIIGYIKSILAEHLQVVDVESITK